ncbi:MAG: TolC family protein [Chitinivibrionales bacterium]
MTDFSKRMSCICFCALPFLLTVRADTLSLKNYVLLSLKNSPQYAIATSSVDASRALRQTALSNLLPSIDAGGDLSRQEANGNTTFFPRTDSAFTVSGTTSQNSAFAGINGKVLLYDFGKTPMQYKAAGKSLTAAEFNFQESIASIILNAKTAYFNYLLSAQLLIVNEEALKQAQEHFKQAQTLFDVGKQAKIAVTNASVDVANAQVNVIHARNTVKLARVQLETVAATKFGEPLVFTDSLSGAEDSIGENEAEKRALESRPEILSAKASLEAADLKVRAEKASFFPSLNASGGFGWEAQDNASISRSDWNAFPNWNIGASLSIPIYEGGAIRAAVAQAQSTVTQSKAQLDILILTVEQQVQQYYLQETDAHERINATAVVIQQATENLQLTQERYKAGLGTSVDLTDAEQSLANARSSHVQALFDYRVAHVNLLLSIGELKE